MTPPHRAPLRRLGLLGLLAIPLLLAACTSEEISDRARFWGDHAAAAALGDDPARD
mgnify:CR=1 FL=1